ncbi:MAG: DNA polymerase IV [Anaerolineales bacterium]
MSRAILHVDLDAFFCSVEELMAPQLKGQAFAVGGRPEGRGVVASASYAARRYGVRSAMPMAQAVRLCPGLRIVRPRHGEYSDHSDRVMQYLRDSVPVVEQISIDEAFLDASDDPRGGPGAAREMQAEIRKRFGLPTSWGVASNKLVAKIATEVGKPNGLISVPAGSEARFLAPLPVAMLWGIGPKSEARLAESEIRTIGQLAHLSEARLVEVFGDWGMELAGRARGLDDRPVEDSYEPRSLSAEQTFAKDVSSESRLRRCLLEMSERVGRRLRQAELAGSTVRIKLRWPDFATITRQSRLVQPTDQDQEIFRAAWSLFQGNWRQGRAVRLLGVGVSDLGPPVRQLGLFDRAWEDDRRLLQAIDSLREKYGPDILNRAGELVDDRD